MTATHKKYPIAVGISAEKSVVLTLPVSRYTVVSVVAQGKWNIIKMIAQTTVVPPQPITEKAAGISAVSPKSATPPVHPEMASGSISSAAVLTDLANRSLYRFASLAAHALS